MSGEPSNFSRALASVREGFLVTRPRSMSWQPGGRSYIDDVAVSDEVWELAYAGDLRGARELWLRQFTS
jgi:hypothetical protein